MNLEYPTLGPIYSVPNNNSVLNFTFIYPTNYQFENLYVRFTIYDFITNDTTDPLVYLFSWLNFTNSNFSLPWVVPPIILQSNDYIIGCFEWVETDNNNQTVSDTHECVLTRAPSNNTILPLSNLTTSAVVVTNMTAMISAYFPSVLPYDQVNISSAINQTILPSMTNWTSNATYSSMNTFTFMNLIPNTRYNICVYFNYANSQINGSQVIASQCQLLTTLASNQLLTTPGSSQLLTTSRSNQLLTTSGSNQLLTTSGSNQLLTTSAGNSMNNKSNMILSKMLIIILLFIFILI